MAYRDLDDILVVSVEQAVAAPYLSLRLAEAGARVIKIERPEGDFARGYDSLVMGESAYFVWLNRGKESVSLDLREDTARAALSRMIAQADIFIQNLAPGAIDRLGFSAEELRKTNPKLITVSISGYGETGPLRDLKAYDLLVQGETGLSSITGTPDGMARVGVSVCDINAGMTAHQAVLQALFARERTGEGRHIAVSLYHALADWMNVPYLQYHYGGKEPARNGLNHPTIAPYGAYAGKDDRAVLLAIQNEREWLNFCTDVLEKPDLANDPLFDNNSKRVANRPQLDAIIKGVFSTLTREDIIERLEKAKTAYGRISSMEDLSAHPQNRYMDVQTPVGVVTLLGSGILFDGEMMASGPVPAHGQHTQAVLDEFMGADS